MSPKKVLYVSPVPQQSNPALDAIASSLQSTFDESQLDMRVVFGDFRHGPQSQSLPGQIESAVAAGVAAILIYMVDPEAGRREVFAARKAGIPVFTIARPRYPVNASLSHPGFNQGVFMMDFLTSQLPEGAGVGIIGGPQALTDLEEVAGMCFSLQRSHCRLLNDPEQAEYANTTDDRAGGRVAARALLERFPEAQGLAPYNDETMLGLLDHLEEIDRVGQLRIVSRNGSPAAVKAVREGRTTGTWDLDAPAIGRHTAELVIRHLQQRQSYEDHAAMLPAGRMITRDNVDSWVPWEERVRREPLRIGLE
jgi:ABC-type sugar transport system substrate-binding protein